jgi:hypothetical protein
MPASRKRSERTTVMKAELCSGAGWRGASASTTFQLP